MSYINTVKHLAFRVHLTPAPRTQSESNAIFRALHEFGSIHTFQISRHEPPAPTNLQDGGTSQSTTATLVYTSNSKALEKLRDRKTPFQISVTANADIPSAELKDPYNIRGLQSRKPELKPRTFKCQITPLGSSRIFDELQKSEYSDTFAVDRNSCFAEILARTDCPSGLIHGLLPKVKDEHRNWTINFGQPEERNEKTSEIIEAGSRDQKVYASRDVRLVPFKLGRAEEVGRNRSLVEQPEGNSANGHVRQDVKFYDEFEDLRGFSLMKLYREATGNDRTRKGTSNISFQPFS